MPKCVSSEWIEERVILILIKVCHVLQVCTGQPPASIVMSVNNRILQNNSICLMLFCMGIIMAYTKASKIIPSKKFQLWLKVFKVVIVIVQTILVSTKARRNWLRHKRVIGQLAGYLYKQCKQQLLWSWNVPLLWFCFSFLSWSHSWEVASLCLEPEPSATTALLPKRIWSCF